MALFIVVLTTIVSIIAGFILKRSFTLEYAFSANFAIAALLIAVGLLFPVVPRRLVEKFRSRQLFEYKMHMEYMEERATKQEEGYNIMWIGIASGLIAGFIEILIWLMR